MRLTEFIEKKRGQIIEEWVAFAATIMPWAKSMSEKDLRDHAAELLVAVVADMQAPQSTREQSAKSQGKSSGGELVRIGQQHASQRLNSGFNLYQLVSEYRALRASILRLWAVEQGETQSEMTRFNEAIDESLVEATVSYSALLDRTREQFVGILGHDLRNPLAAIILGATLLTKSERLDDKEARVATRILNGGQRMNRMVSDLLDLTRTRLGDGIPISRKVMDLMPVCQQVIAELDVVYPDQLRFESKGDLNGSWDSDRLTQMISNLAANALQHGRPAGPVVLVAEGHDDEVVLRVHNEGSAIPAELIEKLFEPMARRGKPDSDRNPTGLGLGLYIAREVVTAHSGTLNVVSTEAGGTTFTAKIPRHPAAAA